MSAPGEATPDNLVAVGTLAMRNREEIDDGTLAQFLAPISERKPKRRLVAFFGRDNFSDNSKYLFLHCRNHAPFEVVWCSHDPGLVARLGTAGLPAFDLGADGARSVALLLSVAVAVHCTNPFEALKNDVLLAALAGARHLQLWHGVGNKHLDLMLFDHPKPPPLNVMQARVYRWSSRVDAVASPSARYDPLWRASFGVRQVVRAGLPRNEVILRPASAAEQIDAVVLPPVAPDALRVLWAPTFSLNRAGPAWANHALAAAIGRGVTGRPLALFVKPHPFDQRNFVDRGLRPAPEVRLLPGHQDIYPALSQFDLLVTDRSSLLSDFLLLDRPVLLFDPTDEGDPDELEVYDTPPPGPTATRDTVSEVLRAMLARDGHAEARAANRRAIFETDPLRACGDVAAIVARWVDELCDETVAVL